MAKGLNLVTTNIVSMVVKVNDDGSAEVIVNGTLVDDGDEVLKTESIVWDFADLPTSAKAQLNSCLRTLSREFNNIKVNEDQETWGDK